jgi:gamma-glutamyltranspeptidase/glutathione hydrolase
MRDFGKPGRSEAFAAKGMVAASHPHAALTALDILKAGGNAVDAAVTAAAVLAVVEPTQTGIGGDCFALLKRRGQPVVAMNGAGWAPSRASAALCAESGATSIDPMSPHAVTVPGAIRTWHRLARDHGTLDWARLMQPAVDAAEHGIPVSERVARDWSRQIPKLQKDADTARVFLRDGAPFQAGDIHRQTALAKALRSIAADGPDVFYQGWIAQDILAKLNAMGGLHEAADFSAWQPQYVQPISTGYRGYALWECPPSGQGVIALAMAAMLERFDLGKLGPLSTERFHLQAEIARLAYAERDHFLCDSDDSAALVRRLLSPDQTARRAARIANDRRLSDVNPAPSPAHSDTVFLAVVDRDGTAVSLINSLYADFGSGILAPRSGVLLHNRACGFVLEPGHQNVVAGRKRPMHTIIPALLTKDDEAVMAFGVTGAHFQPQGQTQVLTNIVDYGMTVQEALDQPRMFAYGDTLELETSVPESTWAGLRALGHKPTRAANPLGTGQAIWIDRARGVLRGGADPRRDGIALGY